MNAIHALATTLSTGTPQTAAGLTLVPLLRRMPARLAYLGFAEALKRSLVEVTELGPGGSVPEVSVLNRGELPVLFLDGEALVGAKQNRVLNLSVLVPGKATTTIPVSCVEAGRWSPRSRAFVDGESLHFAKARACKVANVSQAMAQGMGRRSNQGDVWDAMDGYLADFDAAAPSRAMQDGYAKVQHTVDDLLGKLPALDGQAGAAFLLHGKLLGIDLMGSAEAFAEIHAKVVRSYAVEALRGGPSASSDPGAAPAGGVADDIAAESVRQALAELATASWQQHPAIGLGTDLRLSAPGWDAAALVVDEELVHLAAFPRTRPASP